MSANRSSAGTAAPSGLVVISANVTTSSTSVVGSAKATGSPDRPRSAASTSPPEWNAINDTTGGENPSPQRTPRRQPDETLSDEPHSHTRHRATTQPPLQTNSPAWTPPAARPRQRPERVRTAVPAQPRQTPETVRARTTISASTSSPQFGTARSKPDDPRSISRSHRPVAIGTNPQPDESAANQRSPSNQASRVARSAPLPAPPKDSTSGTNQAGSGRRDHH